MNDRRAECVFCEDIRHEVGNKLSYMGVYRELMLVESFPVTIPNLVVVAWVSTNVDDKIETMELVVNALGEQHEFQVSEDFISKKRADYKAMTWPELVENPKVHYLSLVRASSLDI